MIIIIGTVIAGILSFALPWYYHDLQVESMDDRTRQIYAPFITSSKIEASIYRDFKIEANQLPIYTESFFNLDRTSWGFYIGISKDDFFTIPKITLYCFATIVTLGLIVTIFEFIDNKYDFSIVKFSAIHFTLYSLIIIPCVITLVYAVRFIGFYLQNAHVTRKNPDAFTEALSDIKMIAFPAPYMAVVVSFIVIMICFIAMDSDVNTIIYHLKRKNKEKQFYK